MVEWLLVPILAISAAIGTFLLVAGVFGAIPRGSFLLTFSFVEIGLLIQAAVAIGMTLAGARASVSTFEFFGYLLVALLLPLIAAVWALAEKTKWSTVILGFCALTVAVMLLRMWQIWTGSSYL
jgi:hypothetical protein